MTSPRTAGLALIAALAVGACSDPAPEASSTEVPASWREVRTSLGHSRHLADPRIVCGDCHAAGGFASPGTTSCRRCHEDASDRMHAAPDANAGDCLTCHDFRGDAAPLAACRDCHRDRAPAARRHGDEDCTTCHRPHSRPSEPPCQGLVVPWPA